MAIGDYLEQSDADRIQSKKNGFLDYILALEQKLDEAEEQGKKSRPELLDTLGDIYEIQTEAEDYARDVGQSASLRNCRVRTEKIIEEYIPRVLETEIHAIKNDVESDALRATRTSHICRRSTTCRTTA